MSSEAVILGNGEVVPINTAVERDYTEFREVSVEGYNVPTGDEVLSCGQWKHLVLRNYSPLKYQVLKHMLLTICSIENAPTHSKQSYKTIFLQLKDRGVLGFGHLHDYLKGLGVTKGCSDDGLLKEKEPTSRRPIPMAPIRLGSSTNSLPASTKETASQARASARTRTKGKTRAMSARPARSFLRPGRAARNTRNGGQEDDEYDSEDDDGMSSEDSLMRPTPRRSTGKRKAVADSSKRKRPVRESTEGEEHDQEFESDIGTDYSDAFESESSDDDDDDGKEQQQQGQQQQQQGQEEEEEEHQQRAETEQHQQVAETEAGNTDQVAPVLPLPTSPLSGDDQQMLLKCLASYNETVAEMLLEFSLRYDPPSTPVKRASRISNFKRLLKNQCGFIEGHRASTKASKTKKRKIQYWSKMQEFVSWVLTVFYYDLGDGNLERPTPPFTTSNIATEFLEMCSKKKKKNGTYFSASTIGHYRAAIKHLWDRELLLFPSKATENPTTSSNVKQVAKIHKNSCNLHNALTFKDRGDSSQELLQQLTEEMERMIARFLLGGPAPPFKSDDVTTPEGKAARKEYDRALKNLMPETSRVLVMAIYFLAASFYVRGEQMRDLQLADFGVRALHNMGFNARGMVAQVITFYYEKLKAGCAGNKPWTGFGGRHLEVMRCGQGALARLFVYYFSPDCPNNAGVLRAPPDFTKRENWFIRPVFAELGENPLPYGRHCNLIGDLLTIFGIDSTNKTHITRDLAARNPAPPHEVRQLGGWAVHDGDAYETHYGVLMPPTQAIRGATGFSAFGDHWSISRQAIPITTDSDEAQLVFAVFPWLEQSMKNIDSATWRHQHPQHKDPKEIKSFKAARNFLKTAFYLGSVFLQDMASPVNGTSGVALGKTRNMSSKFQLYMFFFSFLKLIYLVVLQVQLYTDLVYRSYLDFEKSNLTCNPGSQP